MSADLEKWCFDRALSLVTRRLRDALGTDSRHVAFARIAETRSELGVDGYGNGGDRPKPDTDRLARSAGWSEGYERAMNDRDDPNWSTAPATTNPHWRAGDLPTADESEPPCDCDRNGIGGSHEDHCATVVF